MGGGEEAQDVYRICRGCATSGGGRNIEVSIWFIVVFVIMWILGPATQVLQLVAPKLHKRLGLMEAAAYEPEFRWFMIEQRAIAYADLTYLFAGVVFVVLALLDNEWAALFGIYTCACYVYFVAIWIPETLMLMKDDLSPAKREQLPFFTCTGSSSPRSGSMGCTTCGT